MSSSVMVTSTVAPLESVEKEKVVEKVAEKVTHDVDKQKPKETVKEKTPPKRAKALEKHQKERCE